MICLLTREKRLVLYQLKFRVPHNELPGDSYRPQAYSIFMAMKSRRLQCIGYINRIGERRNTQNFDGEASWNTVTDVRKIKEEETRIRVKRILQLEGQVMRTGGRWNWLRIV
jgi:hypothetical protein